MTGESRDSGKEVAGKDAGRLRGGPAGWVAAAAVVAALLAWVSWLWPLAYPFRLLSTLVHELCHGLAALATGGRFEHFVVFADGSGRAYTAGGWRLVVIPAGYLGAAVFGAVLVLAGRRRRSTRAALAAVGGAMLLLTLRYGVPTLWRGEVLAGLLTLSSGIALGALLLALAVGAAPRWRLFSIHLIAFQAALTAFTDLWALIGLSARGGPMTDARNMAAATHVPAIVWALLWALAAAVILGLALRRAWAGPAPEAG